MKNHTFSCKLHNSLKPRMPFGHTSSGSIRLDIAKLGSETAYQDYQMLFILTPRHSRLSTSWKDYPLLIFGKVHLPPFDNQQLNLRIK